MNVLSVYYDNYAHMEKYFKIKTWATASIDKEPLKNMEVLILHGGGDINPKVYNQVPHPETGGINNSRDSLELFYLREAIKKQIPIFAICRGAQLATIAAGGDLFQHVGNNHNSINHPLLTNDGQHIISNSYHHQMCDLSNTEHDLIAWAAPALSSKYEKGEGKVLAPEYEPEIFYLKKINAFCVQGHPEWMPEKDEFVAYCWNKFKEYCNVV